MSLRTQFGGYTPETDLTDSDWTQRFSPNAAATVKGLGFTFVADEVDSSDDDEYIFSEIIDSPGKYVIGVFGEGAATGILDVDVDGMSANEVVADNIDDVDVGLYVVDAQSISVGDITVTFGTGSRTSCGIFVWKLLGKDLEDEYHSIQDILGQYELINVANRTVILGVGGTAGAAASHFWAGVTKRSEQVTGDTEEQSGADKLKVFADSESSFEVGMATDDDSGLSGFWVAASWVSDYGFFPSGQCVELVKTSSNELTLLSWNPAPSVADIETLILIRPTVQSDTMEIGSAVRGANPLATADAYTFVLYQSVAGARDQVALIKRDGGVSTVLDTASFSWSLNTNYWMRLRARGTTLQGRIWAQGTTEPTTWNVEATDSGVSAAGYSGLFHRFTGSEALVGHFEAKVLYAEWPSAVPDYWAVDMAGGPQNNKVAFRPDVGPTIDRRRSSSKVRNYRVEVPGLTQDEYLAFVAFYETTLVEGTLPFTKLDPFSGEEKTFKFVGEDPAYTEELMRPVGPDYVDGLYKVSFSVTRLD